MTASLTPVAASVFFLKSNETAISQPCYDVIIIFSSGHIVLMYKKSNSFVCKFSSIVRFSKQYEAENWHA